MKTRPDHGLAGPALDALASNRATLWLLVGLALSVVVYYRVDWSFRLWLLVVPGVLLALNFVLALVRREVLRRHPPLIVFHFALFALLLMALLGQLTRFTATLELAEGEAFNGRLENVAQGPLHRYALDGVSFVNHGYSIQYRRGIKRERTLNPVELLHADGSSEWLQIGDQVPLIVGHYRFYTSHNKGYAPVFEWQPDNLPARTGSIHLPAFPAHRFGQALEWQVPGTDRRLWTMLRIEDEVLPDDRDFEFSVPQTHRIILRDGEQRHELSPGDSLRLPEGRLRYLRLSTWMGYRVDYDWTRPWLLATAMCGLLGLFTHFIQKYPTTQFPQTA